MEGRMARWKGGRVGRRERNKRGEAGERGGWGGGVEEMRVDKR